MHLFIGFFFFFLATQTGRLFDHKQSSSNQGRFLARFVSLLRFLRVMNFLVLKSAAVSIRAKESEQTEEREGRRL